MQRLRPLSEAECYARCYGGRDESVTLLEVGPHAHVADAAELPLDPAGGRPEPEWSGWAALVPLPQQQA